MVHPARLGHRLSSSGTSCTAASAASRTFLSVSEAEVWDGELIDAIAETSDAASSTVTVAGEAEASDRIEAQDSFLRCLPALLNSDAFETRRRLSSAAGRLIGDSEIELEYPCPLPGLTEEGDFLAGLGCNKGFGGAFEPDEALDSPLFCRASCRLLGLRRACFAEGGLSVDMVGKGYPSDDRCGVGGSEGVLMISSRFAA